MNETEFDRLLGSEEVMLVGFGASWCGNCRSFLPVLERAAEDVEIPLYKISVDEDVELTKRYDVHPVPIRYDVRGVPTVILFENGQEKGRIVGVFSESDMVIKICDLLK